MRRRRPLFTRSRSSFSVRLCSFSGPLYLHVPPGHAKKWSQHCARYNACNRPVYFVKVRGDDDYERRRALQPQAVYMDKNDWKEARKREKEHEKQAKKHGKKHDKHHGQHDHDD